MQADAIAGAFDVRPLQGQYTEQRDADIDACIARAVEEAAWEGHRGPRARMIDPAGGRPFTVAVNTVRTDYYVKCLTERGYAAERLPMTGGGNPAR